MLEQENEIREETFTTRERITLLAVVENTPIGTTMVRVARQFKDALSFSEEEHIAGQIVDEGTIVRWKNEIPPLTIEVGPRVRALIKNGLKTVARMEQFVLSVHGELWDRFVGEEGEEEAPPPVPPGIPDRRPAPVPPALRKPIRDLS